MPPKKDGAAPKEGQKKGKKKCNVKNKNECPSRIRKTHRVVLNSQARDIIAKVYDFMKKEATDNFTQHFKNARWRTATATGVSEKTVSRIIKDRHIRNEGAAVLGTGAVLAGKAGAVANAGLAVGDLLSGNFTGAGDAVANAAGSLIAGDLAGAGIVATGAASAVGQLAGAKLHAAGDVISTVSRAAGQVVGGKLGAAGALAAGVRDLAAGNFSAFGNDLGTAAGTFVDGDAQAFGTLAGGALGLFLGR